MSDPERRFRAQFAADVRRDLALSPKQLQSKYLYDALGSSLFEAICRLPWYRITRAEHRLLDEQAQAIVELASPRREATPLMVELGCGSGEKLALVAEAFERSGRRARVCLIDISSQALEQSERALGKLQRVSVVAYRDSYEAGLRRATAGRDGTQPALVLFLGSNIGNFDPPGALAFLQAIRDSLAPGDALLLGADLVKPEADLRLAYADPLGVTAAFNRNLLVRMNRELGACFDLEAFKHVMVWNAIERRVEMHLESRVEQTVAIPAAGVEVAFAAGERIWTESSYKYELADLDAMASTTGFAPGPRWVDDEARFALSLLTVR